MRATTHLSAVTRIAALALPAVVAAVSACSEAIPDYDYTKEPNPNTTEYTLGISDQVQITVWKNGDLTTSATIRPDGTITMPLIGNLTAAGRTPSELEAEIKKKLSTFIDVETSPITVAVTGANSYRFTVSGEVNSPGVVTSAYYVTVVEAIALAGGFTRFANKKKLILMRRDAKTKSIRSIPIDFTQIASGNRPDMNLFLLSGDALTVP